MAEIYNCYILYLFYNN